MTQVLVGKDVKPLPDEDDALFWGADYLIVDEPLGLLLPENSEVEVKPTDARA